MFIVESVVKLWVEVPPEAPAFVCEKIWLELDISRRTDTGLVEDLGRQRRNTLYVSRGQLKKHSTTALNISVSIRYISQQVSKLSMLFWMISLKLIDAF